MLGPAGPAGESEDATGSTTLRRTMDRRPSQEFGGPLVRRDRVFSEVH